MMRPGNWSIRTRLLLAFLGVLIPYLVLAGVGAVGLQMLWRQARIIRDEAVGGVKGPADLQLAVVQLVMPANDYLITGDPRERELFEQRLARAWEVLARQETIHLHEAAERQLLETVRRHVSEMEALSREILALPDPRANRAAPAKMKALDALGDQAAVAVSRVHEIANREVEEELERGTGVIRRVVAIGFATLILSVAGAVAMAFIFSTWLSRPILAIAEGSRRIAQGDFSQRVETSAGAELADAARAFNEMAERLESSALENVRLNGQVAEYAKGLEQKVEERTKALHAAHFQLLQAEKLASVGTLAAGVAHELNQPLMVIRGYAQELLADERLTDAELREDLRRIEAQTTRMTAIINHLRDFSRQSKGTRQETDLNRLVAQAFTFVGQQLKLRNLTVVQELDPTLPPVWGDPLQLEQVLLNLVTNARDAMEAAGHGTLTLRTHQNAEGRTQKADEPKQGMGAAASLPSADCLLPSVVIEVTDTGPGIPAALQARIFDPFFTTKEVGKGTGLGLSICHGIIQEHGGEIQVESPVTDNRGTRFTVVLPRYPQQAEGSGQ